MATSKDGNQDTGLDKILKDKGIKTVIVVGSAANGAVLNTATSAFFHGYQTIVRSMACPGKIRMSSRRSSITSSAHRSWVARWF